MKYEKLKILGNVIKSFLNYIGVISKVTYSVLREVIWLNILIVVLFKFTGNKIALGNSLTFILIIGLIVYYYNQTKWQLR